MLRIGNGYDVHKLVEGRKLILGGIEIPHTKGVLGHSDGDVLIHAIMDAMLGALALGDIGQHFPDTDMKYENIDSTILLTRVKELIAERGYKIINLDSIIVYPLSAINSLTLELIAERGYKIINLDSIIVLQKPKVKPYIEAMRKRVAEVLEIDIEQVSIKATTEEKLGFTGDESGVKSYCVVLLEK